MPMLLSAMKPAKAMSTLDPGASRLMAWLELPARRPRRTESTTAAAVTMICSRPLLENGLGTGRARPEPLRIMKITSTAR